MEAQTRRSERVVDGVGEGHETCLGRCLGSQQGAADGEALGRARRLVHIAQEAEARRDLKSIGVPQAKPQAAANHRAWCGWDVGWVVGGGWWTARQGGD